MDRDDKIAEEALALWMAVYGEPPIVQADGSQIIEALVQTLPMLPYEPAEPPGVVPAARAEREGGPDRSHDAQESDHASRSVDLRRVSGGRGA